MSHLWIRDAQRDWAVAPLECDAVALHRDPPRRMAIDVLEDLEPDGVVLLRRSQEGPGGWVLLAGPDSAVRVNGLLLNGGIRVLDDRDEIRTPVGGTIFFSTEQQARVETFPGSDTPVHCPRCKLAIEPGSPAVRCPGCFLWFHESEEYPCWRYAEKCSICDQSTAFEAGFRFAPEDL